MDTGHSQAPRKDIAPEGKDINGAQGTKDPGYSGPNRPSTSSGTAECASRTEK